MERFRSKLTPKLLMGLSDTSTRHPATLMAVRLKDSVPATNISVLSVLNLSLLAGIHRCMSVKQLSAWCTPVVWYPGLLDRIWTSKPEYHLHIHAPAAHEIVSGDGVGECR